MGFGRNPHVAKALAAEQKAREAKDDAARVLAWREAARQWDRAAEREAHDKKRQEYTDHAETARARASGEEETEELLDEASEAEPAAPLADATEAAETTPTETEVPKRGRTERWLN